MSKIWTYTVGAGAVAVALIWIAYLVSPIDARNAFAANLLLNLGSGFIGTAIGIVLGVWIASALAAKKVEAIGPAFVALVAQLRREDVLSPPTARKCVVCAARVLTEEHLMGERAEAVSASDQSCDICSLNYDVILEAGRSKCAHCLLPGSVWQESATRRVVSLQGRTLPARKDS